MLEMKIWGKSKFNPFIFDFIIMSYKIIEQLQNKIELYAKLSEAEIEISDGDMGEDFFQFAKKLKFDIKTEQKSQP